MKKFYFEPAIEIKRFHLENIITGSGEITGTSVENVPAGVKAATLSFKDFKFAF